MTRSAGEKCPCLNPDSFDYADFILKLPKTCDEAIEKLYLELGPKQRGRLLRHPLLHQYLSEISDHDRNTFLLMLDPNEVREELRLPLLPQISLAFDQFKEHLSQRNHLTEKIGTARSKQDMLTQKRRRAFLHTFVEAPHEPARSLMTDYVHLTWSYNTLLFPLTLDQVQGFLKTALGSYGEAIDREKDIDHLIGQGLQLLEEKRLNLENAVLKRSYEFTSEILHARQTLARSYLMHHVFLETLRSVMQWDEGDIPKVYKTQKLNGVLKEYDIMTKLMFTLLEQEAQKAHGSIARDNS